jgi:hypothetical protein
MQRVISFWNWLFGQESFVNPNVQVIGIGSMSQVKKEAVALAYLDAELHMCDVVSCVREQPVGREEIMKGAFHRAKCAKDQLPRANFWIGIESGLVFEHGIWQDIACIVIRDQAVTDVLWSDPLDIPKQFIMHALDPITQLPVRLWSNCKDPHYQMDNHRSRARYIADAIISSVNY